MKCDVNADEIRGEIVYFDAQGRELKVFVLGVPDRRLRRSLKGRRQFEEKGSRVPAPRR